MQKKHGIILLLALAIIAALFMSWTSTDLGSADPVRSIVVENNFKTWSFSDQAALAEVIQAAAEGKPPNFESMPAKVRTYVEQLIVASETLRGQYLNNSLPPNIKEELNKCECTSWDKADPAIKDLQILESETKRGMASDFRNKPQKVVSAYIELTKNWLLKKEIGMAPGIRR